MGLLYGSRERLLAIPEVKPPVFNEDSCHEQHSLHGELVRGDVVTFFGYIVKAAMGVDPIMMWKNPESDKITEFPLDNLLEDRWMRVWMPAIVHNIGPTRSLLKFHPELTEERQYAK